MTNPQQPGWYDDPFSSDQRAERYWDGQEWTPRRRPRKAGSPIRSESATQPSTSSTPPNQQPSVAARPGPAAFPSPPAPYTYSPPTPNNGPRTGPFKSAPILIGVGVVLVVAIIGAILLAGNHRSSSRGSGDTASSGQTGSQVPTTQPGSISGGTEDWLRAICQPGGYKDGIRLDMFTGALGGGSCFRTVAGRAPVFLTQWDSDYKMQNSMAMLHMCYASAIEPGGMIDTFSVIGRNTAALQPLTRFGFSMSC